MKVSEIKVGYIYNVIFDPVEECEFNGKHLAVVLKKNNDKKTFIVMPLTSSAKGVGINKIRIGIINSLPYSLRDNQSYAVYNQIRTINANRFIALKEGNYTVECSLDENIFNSLLCLGIRELVYGVDNTRRICILKKAYEEECVEKAKDLAYNIIKIRKNENRNSKLIHELIIQIKEILINVPYSLNEKYIKDGIKEIFEEAINS